MKKQIKVIQEIGEDVISYIKRIKEMQIKESKNEVEYIGEYIDTSNSANKYYFQGTNLPKLTEGVEYEYMEHGAGELYDFALEHRNDNKHYYTYHTGLGFITSDEINECQGNSERIEELGVMKREQKEEIYNAWNAEQIARAEKMEQKKLEKNQKDAIDLLKAGTELGENLSDIQAVAILRCLGSYCIKSKTYWGEQFDIQESPVFSTQEFSDFIKVISKKHQPDDIGYQNPDGGEQIMIDRYTVTARAGVGKNSHSLINAFLSRAIYDYNDGVQDSDFLRNFGYKCLETAKLEELDTRNWSKANDALRKEGYLGSPSELLNMIKEKRQLKEFEE